MKTRLPHVIQGYLLGVIILSFAMYGPEWLQQYQRWHDSNSTIYAIPESVEWSKTQGGLIVQGVSRKLERCEVVGGTKVWLTVYVGNEPRSFPAIKPSGKVLEGKSIVKQGDEFLVGPWLIEADDDTLSKIKSVSVRLECRFSSGVERVAEIGPMLR